MPRLRGVSRRAFVRDVAATALAVQVLPLAARAAASSPGRGGAAADDLVIQSSAGLLFHVHRLDVPRAVLRTPPRQGVALSTSKALFHTHDIALSQRQLISIRQGGTVTAKRSSHLFVIALAGATPGPERRPRYALHP